MRRWEVEVEILTGAPIYCASDGTGIRRWLRPSVFSVRIRGGVPILHLGIGVTGSTRAFEVRSSGSNPGSPAKQQEASHAIAQRYGIE